MTPKGQTKNSLKRYRLESQGDCHIDCVNRLKKRVEKYS